MGRGTNALKLMIGIGIDTILAGAVLGGVEWSLLVASMVSLRIVCRGDACEDEKRRLAFENMFVCDEEAGIGFGAAGVPACDELEADLGMLAEAIVFLIALIAAVLAAEALAFTFFAATVGKSFGATGLD